MSFPTARAAAVLLVCCAAGAAPAQAPAFSKQLALDVKAAATAVVLNATDANVTYRVWYTGRGAADARGRRRGRAGVRARPRRAVRGRGRVGAAAAAAAGLRRRPLRRPSGRPADVLRQGGRPARRPILGGPGGARTGPARGP